MPIEKNRCAGCKNWATRYYDGDHLCEIHYAARGRRALIDPENIRRCDRCGMKSLTRNGRGESLAESDGELLCGPCKYEKQQDGS